MGQRWNLRYEPPSPVGPCRPKLFDSGEPCGNKVLLRIPLPRRKHMPYKDPEEQKACQRRYNSSRRRRFIKEHGGKCIKCGSKKRLEFDHIDRSTKTSHSIWSWREDRIREELKKCQLLCKACHINKTHAERGDRVLVHGSLFRGYHRGCKCVVCRRANADYEYKRRHGKERT